MEVTSGILKSRLPFVHPFTLGIGLLILSLVSGCRNCDLVEAELRSRETELREMREEMDRLEAHNGALERELGAIHETASATSRMPPELASQTYTLRSIQLGRPTGGLNDDKDPGDEALQVLVEPRDGDGHVIKAPGTLTVEVLEITPEGLKRPLCSWRIDSDKLRRSWRAGLLTTGYYLVLPWKVYPT
jgi:hypothetical protein